MPLHNHKTTPSKAAANAPAAAEATEHPTAEPETKPVPTPVTAEETKALFAAYAHADAEVSSHEKAVEAARTKRSAAIAAIADRKGTGPFLFRGEEVTFIKGKAKEGDDTVRWTKRTKHEKEVTTIE